MKTKLTLLLVFSLLAATVSPPRPASAQGRNVGLGPTRAGAGGYHALVIGNNAYEGLPRLKTAEADAREVAALLKDLYGFETTLLLNATRGQIISALSGYRRRLGPESSLLVYYAGHGFNEKGADKAYWLPVDATAEDTSNWIIADEITTQIKVIPARHVLVVSDSCYSGTLTRELSGNPPSPESEREQFLQKMAAGRSRTLMASGGDEPVADGGGGGKHSVFANALLRGLREMDEARFTGAELFRKYVEVSVAGRSDQTPEYSPLRNSGHEGGDFVFVKLKADGKNAEVTTKAPTPTVDPAAFELEYWNAIKNSNDPEAYKDYLKSYPGGRFADIARRRVNTLNQAAQPDSGAPSEKTAADGDGGLRARAVTIPPDTVFLVELLNQLSTDVNRRDDRFVARVIEPRQFAGAVIGGRVADVKRPGRSSGSRSSLTLVFDRILLSSDGWREFAAQVTEVLPQTDTAGGDAAGARKERGKDIRLEPGQRLRIRTTAPRNTGLAP